MRKLVFILLLSALLPICSYAQESTITTTQPTATDQQQTTTPATPEDTNQQKKPDLANLLFVITAKNGVMKFNKDGSYTLTFFGVNPYTTYFTNRPNRAQGLAAITNFMKAWNVGKNNFKDNHPNAVITAGKINNLENNSQQFYIVTLSLPKYSVRQGAMQFIAQPLSQKILFKDLRFDNVTLVIE